MMKSLLSILGLVAITNGASCTESNTWISLPNMPEPTGEVGSVVLIGNTLYVAGEQNEDTYAFDFDKNEWSTVAKRLYPGNHQSSQVINNQWYIIGGIDEMSYGKVQVYNPSDNKWTEKESMPYDGGSVQTVYYSKTNEIYACGGIVGFDNGSHKGGTNTTNKCARYSVSQNKWYSDIPNMPSGRNHAATGIDDNGNMWIFGGRQGKNVVSNGFNTTMVLNLDSKTWKTSDNSNIKSIPVGRGGTGVAVYHNNKFYVFGGETITNPGGYATSNNVYNRTDIYDVTNNEWSNGKIMPLARHGIYPVYRDGAIYIAGGGVHDGFSTNPVFDAYCL